MRFTMTDANAGSGAPGGDPHLAEAQASLRWYSSHAWRARTAYQGLEVFQIGTGAMIPLAAAVHWPIAVSATLGACIAVAGGVRSVFRWQANWVAWSITAANMTREIALYKARAEPYTGEDRGQRLVTTVHSLEVAETLQWAAQAQQSDQRRAEASGPSGPSS
jgi:hypothetical protein